MLHSGWRKPLLGFILLIRIISNKLWKILKKIQYKEIKKYVKYYMFDYIYICERNGIFLYEATLEGIQNNNSRKNTNNNREHTRPRSISLSSASSRILFLSIRRSLAISMSSNVLPPSHVFTIWSSENIDNKMWTQFPNDWLSHNLNKLSNIIWPDDLKKIYGTMAFVSRTKFTNLSLN